MAALSQIRQAPPRGVGAQGVRPAIKAPLPSIPRDTFVRQVPAPPPDLGPVEQLASGNAEAAATLWEALKEMGRHPLDTAKNFGKMLIEPFIHPLRAIERVKNSYKNDGPLEAALTGTLYASTAVTTGSFIVMGLALIAAPFTGGASLAIAAAASQVMIWTGFLDAGLCTAILAKDEFDLATADTPEEYERNVGQLADDYVNTALAWVTLPWTDAQTAASAVPQGMTIAGRLVLKKPAAFFRRSHLPAFRAVSNSRRQDQGN